MDSDDQARVIAEPALQLALGKLDAVAAQLVEAACGAWNGDRDTVKTRISHALALLGDELRHAAPAPRACAGDRPPVFRGGLPAWQARRLVAYVDAHLAARISLGDLARVAGLSNGHFSRAFKQTFGVSAHRYVMRRRIDLAQSVMLKTQKPLSEIALTCGLSDQSHFTRAFRRIVGDTPNAWRRARRDALAYTAAAFTPATAPTAVRLSGLEAGRPPVTSELADIAA